MNAQLRSPLLDQLVRGTLEHARVEHLSIDTLISSSAEGRALVAYVTTRFANVHELVTAFAPRLSLLVDDDVAQVFAATPTEDVGRELRLLVLVLMEATHGRFPIDEVRFTEVIPTAHSTLEPQGRGRRMLTFSSALLDLPLGLAALSAITTVRPVPAATLTERVRKSLNRLLGSGEPTTLARVATELGMSRRALQRGLQGGVHYQQVAAQVFSERAVHLLRNRPDLSIKEVASMLGFSGTRAFTRAFKRWFAQVPSEARSAPPDSRVVRRAGAEPTADERAAVGDE